MAQSIAARSIGIAIVCAMVALLAFGSPASGEVVSSGTFTLPAHSENETAWITVPAGHALSYTTTADAYISYWAEVQGQGTAGGGDGGAISGCLVSPQEFQFRLRWTNSQILGARDANVTYQVDVNDTAPGCTDVAEAVEAHDFDNMAPPGFGTALLNGFLISIGIGGAVAVTFVIVARKAKPKKVNPTPAPEQSQGPPIEK